MKNKYDKQEQAIKKLCELYRKNPEKVTFTVKYKNDMRVKYAPDARVRGASEICIALDIDGLSAKSILNLDDGCSVCRLIVDNNTRIPEIAPKLAVESAYGLCRFASNVYRHVSATYAAMPLSRKYQNAIINTVRENAANIRPIVDMYSSEIWGYKVTIGTEASIKTDRRSVYRGPQRYLTDLTVVNKNPELPLPARVSMQHMAVSNPIYVKEAEFAALVNQLMHDLYTEQKVR